MRAQLVEFGVVAVGDDAAVAQHARRVRRAMARSSSCSAPRVGATSRLDSIASGVRRLSRQLRNAARQQLERCRASRDRSRGRAERSATRAVMRSMSATLRQRSARSASCSRPFAHQCSTASCRARSRGRDRAADDAASGAASGCPSRCSAGVQQRKQRGRRFAAQGLGDFQVAPRRGVERM